MGQPDHTTSQYPASTTNPAHHANTTNRRFGPEKPRILRRFDQARYTLTNGTNKMWEYSSLVAANRARWNNGTLKQATRRIVAHIKPFGHPERSTAAGFWPTPGRACRDGITLIFESKLKSIFIAVVSETGQRRRVFAVPVRRRHRAVRENHAG